jgi:hypothetical protein
MSELFESQARRAVVLLLLTDFGFSWTRAEHALRRQVASE